MAWWEIVNINIHTKILWPAQWCNTPLSHSTQRYCHQHNDAIHYSVTVHRDTVTSKMMQYTTPSQYILHDGVPSEQCSSDSYNVPRVLPISQINYDWYTSSANGWLEFYILATCDFIRKGNELWLYSRDECMTLTHRYSVNKAMTQYPVQLYYFHTKPTTHWWILIVLSDRLCL